MKQGAQAKLCKTCGCPLPEFDGHSIKHNTETCLSNLKDEVEQLREWKSFGETFLKMKYNLSKLKDEVEQLRKWKSLGETLLEMKYKKEDILEKMKRLKYGY